jgi:hypothetical protein
VQLPGRDNMHGLPYLHKEVGKGEAEPEILGLLPHGLLQVLDRTLKIVGADEGLADLAGELCAVASSVRV